MKVYIATCTTPYGLPNYLYCFYYRERIHAIVAVRHSSIFINFWYHSPKDICIRAVTMVHIKFMLLSAR